MIIVENGTQISDFITELNLEFGAVKLDTAGLEFTNIYPNEFYIVHCDILSKIPVQSYNDLSQATGVILFGNEECDLDKLPNVIFQYNPKLTNKSVFRNQVVLLQDLISESEVMRSQLISLNKELAQMTGSLEHELLRLKRAHERKSPKRLEEVKGVNFYSKYSAGESMGGEFFDMFKFDNQVFIMMSSTSSYLASSSILTFFTALKMEDSLTKQVQMGFIQDLKEEIAKINHNKEKKIEAHLFTATIDLMSYKVEGYNLGRFSFKSSSGQDFSKLIGQGDLFNDIDSGKFQFQLKRGEKIMLTSPGFTSNWEKLNSEFIPEDILTKPGVKSLDILDELFFQMKKDVESGFLEKDASVILLEVDRNVMVQI